MISFKNIALEFKKIIDKSFSSNGFECRKLFYEKNVYYCAIDVLKYLGYNEENGSLKKILETIDKKNKFTINELREMYKKDDCLDINLKLISSLTNHEKKYIFIDKNGLCKLLNSSNKKEAKPFQDFIYDILLSTLDKAAEEYDKQKDIIDLFN